MLKVTKVKRNSILKDFGIEKGDLLVSFDGYPAEDELDLLYYATLERFTLTVQNRRTGERVDVEIEKDEDEPLGVEVEKNTAIRTCQNRCIFCFVDQMPKGMRDSLYIKDDDYGMSFTCGNFVTLTNLSDEGLKRIVRLGLSPLYISVHAVSPDVRVKLLRNRFAGKIADQIKTLAEGGVEMHCQAVIVPNVNDGDELALTARELFKYYPKVKDLAVVPTGLTKYRAGLTQIPDVDGEYSAKFLQLVDDLNAEFGVNFILPADEYFIKAGKKLKNVSFYGDFEQIENGIGMTSKFCFEVQTALDLIDVVKLKKPKKSLIVSGVSAAAINAELAKQIQQKVEGLDVDVLAVKNSFFGETVTCTGLLTGQDILAALEEYRARGDSFDEVVLPANTLKEFEDVFLCGMTLAQLKKRLKCKNVRVNKGGGQGLVDILIKG